MITIHKQILGRPSLAPIELKIPAFSQYLSAGLQDGQIVVWYLCNTNNAHSVKTFYVVGTGWNVPFMENPTHIATIQEGHFIWHVFVEKNL